MAEEPTTHSRPDNRRRQLLDAAARRFAAQGYVGTSIRDIAADVGMLPGSIYYHFKSKEDLMLAVHGEGVRHIFEAVHDALESATDRPWDRLEAAAVAHLKALCEDNQYAMIVTPEFLRGFEQPLRSEIIAQRDEYEALFRSLLNDLPLPDDVDRSLLRLSLFGALNWVTTWYQPGGDSLEDIARGIIGLYRHKLDPQTK
ncbi:MAG: TetR/AcrR family transcriptional regulator [Alphaproteobacteria bacterium]|nr:MAG: TetR/AcrR family transcriptional regulator [Alphaproteobacteria bacterium]